MSTRITRADLESAIKNLDRAAMSAGYDTPNGHTLAIEMGSRTNGIAYRVTYLPTGEYSADVNARRELCPLWSQGVVGRTATEAYNSITAMTYALDAISRRQVAAPYSHPMSAEATASVTGVLVKDWGPDRYIVSMVGAGHGSALAECTSSDGGRFYVGSTRYGNTVWHIVESHCRTALAAEIARERAALTDSAN